LGSEIGLFRNDPRPYSPKKKFLDLPPTFILLGGGVWSLSAGGVGGGTYAYNAIQSSPIAKGFHCFPTRLTMAASSSSSTRPNDSSLLVYFGSSSSSFSSEFFVSSSIQVAPRHSSQYRPSLNSSSSSSSKYQFFFELPSSTKRSSLPSPFTKILIRPLAGVGAT